MQHHEQMEMRKKLVTLLEKKRLGSEQTQQNPDQMPFEVEQTELQPPEILDQLVTLVLQTVAHLMAVSCMQSHSLILTGSYAADSAWPLTFHYHHHYYWTVALLSMCLRKLLILPPGQAYLNDYNGHSK